jgi:hypothetical protein
MHAIKSEKAENVKEKPLFPPDQAAFAEKRGKWPPVGIYRPKARNRVFAISSAFPLKWLSERSYRLERS